MTRLRQDFGEQADPAKMTDEELATHLLHDDVNKMDRIIREAARRLRSPWRPIESAPTYEPTEADVERVARAICALTCSAPNPGCGGADQCYDWRAMLPEARAAIRAFLEGK